MKCLHFLVVHWALLIFLKIPHSAFTGQAPSLPDGASWFQGSVDLFYLNVMKIWECIRGNIKFALSDGLGGKVITRSQIVSCDKSTSWCSCCYIYIYTCFVMIEKRNAQLPFKTSITWRQLRTLLENFFSVLSNFVLKYVTFSQNIITQKRIMWCSMIIQSDLF